MGYLGHSRIQDQKGQEGVTVIVSPKEVTVIATVNNKEPTF